MRSRSATSWSNAYAVAIVAASAAAAPSQEPIRVSYHAPPGCPSEARFWGEISARTDRVRRAQGDEPARSFVVLVDTGPTGSRGALDTTDTSGVSARREVTGDGCAEVVSALALIAALTVDTQARTDPNLPIRPQPPEVVEPLVSAAPSNTVVGPTGSGSPAPPASSAPAFPQAAPGRPAVRPEVNLTSYEWSIGVQGQSIVGLTPTWAPGAGGFVGLESKSDDPLSPSFRLTPWFAMIHSTFAGALGADITWVSVRFEACPVRPLVAKSLRIGACVGMDGGAMRTMGVGVEHPDTEWHPWFAPLVAARLAWSVSESVALELGLGATFPLRRYPFAFDPGGGEGPQEVFKLRPLGALLTLGVAYTLP